MCIRKARIASFQRSEECGAITDLETEPCYLLIRMHVRLNHDLAVRKSGYTPLLNSDVPMDRSAISSQRASLQLDIPNPAL